MAIYEFEGCCPVLVPQPYIRTKPAKMAKIKDEVNKKNQVRFTPTQEVQYLKGYAIEGKFNNIKARTKPGGQAFPKANFADQVAVLEELQHTLPFCS